jgi:xylan 1,4-beta-xylosidase
VTPSRRGVFGLSALGLLGPSLALAEAKKKEKVGPNWGLGVEGQRKADLGNGTYLNPIMSGDCPDPTILKDGDDYYMTFSAFESYPALVIWHSRDLVNWQPLNAALAMESDIVFACDLVKHKGRYFIYIPLIPKVFGPDAVMKVAVIYADDIRGPWSSPIDLGISGAIDPGHAVGEDGKRYLFLSGTGRVKLTDDGLATDGPVEHVYDGWKYPDDWVTEAFALEGPKITRHGDYFYLISAVGGTSGPATGHMVIAARSKSINGPWENCPQNPIVHTKSDREQWLSRGHATLVEGPSGGWYMVYHGYESGFRTLGRQTLLEPIEWTQDGWFRALGGDLSEPLPMPIKGRAVPHGIVRSDDFKNPSLGARWTFYDPEVSDGQRASFGPDGLTLKGKGTGPADASPLTGRVGDHAYEISVGLELIGDVQGGLLLFFDKYLFLGMGTNGVHMTTYKSGRVSFWQEPNAPKVRKLYLKIVNDHHIVTSFYSQDGKVWTRHGLHHETSGYNANTIDDLASLRPALFASGPGRVRFTEYCFKALA